VRQTTRRRMLILYVMAFTATLGMGSVFAQQANVEAGKKEGKVVVYGSVVPQAMEGLRDLDSARVISFSDLVGFVGVLSGVSAGFGITPEVSGAHAGEFETSIIAALRPDLIRWSRLTPGMVTLPDDPQTLFYPSLRKHAANGVVGDPRAAAAERAEHYLSAWVNFLIAAYEETDRVAAGR